MYTNFRLNRCIRMVSHTHTCKRISLASLPHPMIMCGRLYCVNSMDRTSFNFKARKGMTNQTPLIVITTVAETSLACGNTWSVVHHSSSRCVSLVTNHRYRNNTTTTWTRPIAGLQHHSATYSRNKPKCSGRC